MAASSTPFDAERELEDLRRRAYGPHPDIQADPAALARLRELEAARSASPPYDAYPEIGPPAAVAADEPAVDGDWSSPDPPDWAAGEHSPPPLWQRLTSKQARRASFVAGALVALVALVYTVAGLVGPRADATLHPIADEPDRVVLSLLRFVGADVDRSTVRGYQTYRGFQPWFSRENGGSQCFMLVDRSTSTVDGANCVPPGVDLFADVGEWPLLGEDYTEGLPDGSIIRFHYRGDSVDVFLYPSSTIG